MRNFQDKTNETIFALLSIEIEFHIRLMQIANTLLSNMNCSLPKMSLSLIFHD